MFPFQSVYAFYFFFLSQFKKTFIGLIWVFLVSSMFSLSKLILFSTILNMWNTVIINILSVFVYWLYHCHFWVGSNIFSSPIMGPIFLFVCIPGNIWFNASRVSFTLYTGYFLSLYIYSSCVLGQLSDLILLSRIWQTSASSLNLAMPVYMWFLVAFVLLWWSSCDRETRWPAKLQIFAVWFFAEKICCSFAFEGIS